MADNRERLDAPNTPMPSWVKTDRPSATKLNRLSRAVGAIYDEVIPGQANSAGIRPIICYMMKIKEVLPDILTCTFIDESGETDPVGTVLVAKPPLLRKALWDDKTRNDITFEWNDDAVDGGERTAIDEDDVEEIQVIVPSYQPEDVIFAMRNATGILNGTGLVFKDDPTSLAPAIRELIVWQDMNVDGRMWARKLDQVLFDPDA